VSATLCHKSISSQSADPVKHRIFSPHISRTQSSDGQTHASI